jgi:hypothetical protein
MTTKLEFLMKRWHEVKRLRDQKAAEIAALTGDEHWVLRKNIPGAAIYPISQWVGLCRLFASVSADIERERQNAPTEMVLN